MKKDDYFDLIIKGFGVYLLVLAIIQIPSAVNGVIMLFSYIIMGWNFTGSEDVLEKMIKTVQVTMLSKSLGGLFAFTIYIIASVNFLRSGSLVRKLMKKGKNVEPKDALNSDTAAAESE